MAADRSTSAQHVYLKNLRKTGLHIADCIHIATELCCSQSHTLTVGTNDSAYISVTCQALSPFADDPAVEQAMQQCIQHPDFGREQDAVCGWLYEWSRSDAPVLQRFVARFAPDLARQYLFHCLSTQEVEPVPGLEVSSAAPDKHMDIAPWPVSPCF